MFSASRASSHVRMRFVFWSSERLLQESVMTGRPNLGVGGKEILGAREEMRCCGPVLAAFLEECMIASPVIHLTAYPGAAFGYAEVIIAARRRGIT